MSAAGAPLQTEHCGTGTAAVAAAGLLPDFAWDAWQGPGQTEPNFMETARLWQSGVTIVGTAP